MIDVIQLFSPSFKLRRRVGDGPGKETWKSNKMYKSN